MIVLNPDKQIVVIQNWDDICSRPGFNANLDSTAHELKAIIGRYALREHVPCGLADCHTPHGKGFIVVTKDGQETNIGRDCGHKYFGVDFDTLSSQFERDLQEKENRDKVFNFVFRMDEVQARIQSIRCGAFGADWAYKTSLPLTDGGRDVPASIVRKLSQMAKTRTPVLEGAREATTEEIEHLESVQGRPITRPHYLAVPIAVINGLEALYPENNLRDLLVIGLDEPLKQLESLPVDVMTFAQLKHWARWVGEVESLLERAQQALALCRRLLVARNLAPLSDALQLNSEQHDQFRRYLKQLPKTVTEETPPPPSSDRRTGAPV